ncbi:MAG: alpha/beta hydrolase [Clostridia bacterium]
MKNVILIHGYNGIPKIYEWLKEKLVQKGNLVIMPKFPTQEGVIYDIWKKIFDDYKNNINEETIVIAHSIGNEFLIKYLAENNINIKIYVSLAGFADSFENEEKEDLNRAIKEFLVTTKEVEMLNKLVCKKYSIYSDNDHIVPFDILEKYPKIIGAKAMLIKGIGHMGKKSGLETIPEVLDIIDNN